MDLPWEKAFAANIFGDTDEGCRTTKLANLTSDVPPDSSGMGCNRKCSSISKILLNHKCWTWHWPIKMKLYILSKSTKIFDLYTKINTQISIKLLYHPDWELVASALFFLDKQMSIQTLRALFHFVSPGKGHHFLKYIRWSFINTCPPH